MSGQASPPRLPHHRVLPEPKLIFAPGPDAPGHVHPLLGLARHGPYSRPPGDGPVRVATLTALGQGPVLREFLRGLRQAHAPTDRRSYVPPYPGFEQIFGGDVVPAPDGCHLEVPGGPADGGTDSQDRIVAELGRAVARLHASRDLWDVVVFLLPAAWERHRTSPDGRFDLHDRLKAAAAPLGVPVQMLRQASALAYGHPASLAWRLSVALIAKAGGTPWRVAAATPEDTAYVGLAYAIRGGTSDQFVTCCSQVLDGQGGGLEFVAYNVGAARDLINPHLTRDEMRAVMARSARLYQHRHGGRMPRRVSVHKTTRWRDDEVRGVIDAWSAVEDVECLTVQERPPWRAVVLDEGSGGQPSRPADWPVARGTVQQLSGTEALVWVNATARRMSVRGGRYNPNVKGLPTPLLLVRDAGHGPLETAAADMLALSTLDWNNDAPFDAAPVTIKYSQRLAGTIAHVPELTDGVYPYRLFM
jgi:hypothetical protein